MQTNPWTTKSTEIIYSNNWIELKHHEVIKPSGGEGTYSEVHFKNIAAAIIPIDNEGFTYLVGQFRYPLNLYSWELPMGGSPFSENILDGAKRELLEETGLVAEKWTEIAKTHTSNCVTDELGVIYLAQNLTQREAIPDDTEVLTIKKIHFKEVLKMAENGEITDAISLIGIFKLARILKY